MKTSYPFPFGTIFIEYIENTLTGIQCTKSDYELSVKEWQTRSDFSDYVMKQITEYLNGKRKYFDIKYCLNGTEFQKKVCNVLLKIPYGEIKTYKQIAEAIGNPKASRAIGMANNKNPLLLLVPCHRVIATDGSLRGYAGGIEMKKYLIELERKNILCSI